MTEIYCHEGVYVPYDRWTTEHGDRRVSFWGMGYETREIARTAISAHESGGDLPSGVLLDESKMRRMRSVAAAFPDLRSAI